MEALPSGTVTLLFTDVEGSTKLLRKLGDQYADVLAEHRRVLRDACAMHGGVEVDTQGDAFFFAFPRGSEAVAAASEAQAALAPGPIRVRMGIHTGEPVLTGEGYVGLDVHRAARVCGAAHGGQVLLSDATRRIVEVDAQDLGEHRLKDMLAPQRLHQLGHAEFPPPNALYGTNLPVQSSPLVGREQELREIIDLLGRNRLVTLTGAGGAGKTRLALQVAAELAADFEGGVWWVPLQTLADPALVRSAVGQALGATDDVVGFIGQKHLLLLLDNFEQVVVAAPEVAALLARCRNARILVTSREQLRVAAECVYVLPALDTGDAVTLFLDRARSGGTDLLESAVVADICRRLDGLPLAVELAAARANVLAPHQILDRLERRLDLLTSGARDAPARQKTLRATIEWSHDLLGNDERLLFARLAVFSGSFSLESAEAVCGADVNALGSLVDKNLVRRIDDRFAMLETIAEYAAERFAASDSAEELRRHHAEHFLGLVERGDPRTLAADCAPRIASEYENLRAALGWGTASESALATRLGAALWAFWWERGMLVEGRYWLESALRYASAEASPARASALAGASWLATLSGDHERSDHLARAAIDVAETLGDWPLVVFALDVRGDVALAEGRSDDARCLFERAAELARARGDGLGLAMAVNDLGNLAACSGRWDDAIPLYEESVVLRGDAWPYRAIPLLNLALAELESERDPASVAVRYAEVFRLAWERDDAFYAAAAVHGLGLTLAHASAPEAATRVLGAAAAQQEALDYALVVPERDVHRDTIAELQSELGDERFSAAWAEGRALTPEQAFSLALESIH